MLLREYPNLQCVTLKHAEYLYNDMILVLTTTIGRNFHKGHGSNLFGKHQNFVGSAVDLPQENIGAFAFGVLQLTFAEVLRYLKGWEWGNWLVIVHLYGSGKEEI